MPEYDGISYADIERDMPDVHRAERQTSPLSLSPGRESYEDVIERLEPIIFALEHRREPLLVVAHQAVLRAVLILQNNLESPPLFVHSVAHSHSAHPSDLWLCGNALCVTPAHVRRTLRQPWFKTQQMP